MSLRSRISNLFRGDGLRREIDEELASHIAEAIREGRDPDEVRRAFGSSLRRREESRDIRLIPWLDSLRADVVFGWRQLRKRKVTSAAAILSLALAIGSCTSAFRLIDALLLRPLPVTEPERLYALSRQGIGADGNFRTDDGWEYPLFRQMRDAVKDQANLIAISYSADRELTFGSAQDTEKAFLQYVSGGMFGWFGLRPEVGRLLTENDDLKPMAHPYAVLSHDFWMRRFAGDPKVIGRTFRLGGVRLFEIVGVVEGPFTGTEPGIATDIFLPTMMHPGVDESDWAWLRTLARLKPGAPIEPIRERLQPTFRTFREEMAKRYPAMPKQQLEGFLNQKVLIEPAAAGFSGMQKEYRVALASLGALVAMVLLIACANVANLMTAQAAARTREMALRVSIGAGRWRLVQGVLVESALVAFLAAAIGGLFAWWSAPLVVRMINPPDHPARLLLPADWRVLGFGLALTAAVTLLFGLAPALRASSVKPASALKGGDDPQSRHRMMRVLIAAQVAFCFLVLLVAGLFVATFDRLSHQPVGFSSDRLITLDTATEREQPAAAWYQMAENLRSVPGVETAALAGFPLLSGHDWSGLVAVNGVPHETLTHFLDVSPGWLDVMKIPLVDGRDFRASDTFPGVAIVNGAFVKQHFKGENPIGKWFQRTNGRANPSRPMQIVGVVPDVRFRGLRGPIPPVGYLPFQWIDDQGALTAKNGATFIVRTSISNPLALVTSLRQELTQSPLGFRVREVRTQAEINQAQTVRERLLAMLALFFGAVALLLAGIGLYGVLDYTVVQRRREIGIRMAIGAQAGDIGRRLTLEVLTMVMAGALAGVVAGMASVRYIETLLYGVKATDLAMLAVPSLTILTAALLAALAPVIRAMRIDPVAMLRAE